MTGRDANRGECAQPCRYKYHLVEEKREGEYYPIYEDEKGTYIMNSKDLCMIEHIPELMETGVVSFKIEGRMKSSYYVATVCKAYREAVDNYLEDPLNYKFQQKWMDNLLKPSHRQYYTGFYFGDPNKQIYESSSYIRDYDIVGVVREYNEEYNIASIEQRNKVYNGDTVEVLRPVGDNVLIVLKDMRDSKGEIIASAPRAQMLFTVNTMEKLCETDILIKSKEEK
jgi:putative protease